MEPRKCTQCGLTKSLAAFPLTTARGVTYRRRWCKPCLAEYFIDLRQKGQRTRKPRPVASLAGDLATLREKALRHILDNGPTHADQLGLPSAMIERVLDWYWFTVKRRSCKVKLTPCGFAAAGEVLAAAE